MTFLEFFEALLGCAEVSDQRDGQTSSDSQMESCPLADTRRVSPGERARDSPLQRSSQQHSPLTGPTAKSSNPNISPDVGSVKSLEVGLISSVKSIHNLTWRSGNWDHSLSKLVHSIFFYPDGKIQGDSPAVYTWREPRQSPNTAGNLTSQTGGVFSSHIFPLLTYPYSLTGHIFAALLKVYACVWVRWWVSNPLVRHWEERGLRWR